MKDWVPLLKTWVAISFLHETEPYTREEIKMLTGLTDSMIRKCESILEKHNVLFETRVYAGPKKCLGNAVDLTHEAFYSIE